MKLNRLEKASCIVQGIYCVLFLIDAVLFLIHQVVVQDNSGTIWGFIALPLAGWLIFMPALPANMIINICACVKRKKDGRPRKFWVLWTVVSPTIYLALSMVAIVIMVSINGGV